MNKYVVRCFPPKISYDTRLERTFLREVQVWSILKHPCILPLVGISRPVAGQGWKIITKYQANGSLEDVLGLARSHKSPLFWNATGISKMVCELVLGMRYLHSRKILHRCLRPGGLLIDDGGHLLIGCFEESRFAGESELTLQVGSPHYMAPEMYEEDGYNEKVDVFSFGLILYEMLTVAPVFSKDLLPLLVMKRVLMSERAPIPDTLPSAIHRLIETCWQANPDQRPTFDQIFATLSTCDFKVLAGADVHEVRQRVEDILGFTARC
jgi:serine/threonine protein kinase